MYEDGPANAVLKLRRRLGVKYEYGLPVNYTGLGTIFSCFWCLSIWVSVFVLKAPKVIQTTLALSALCIALQERLIGNSTRN